MSVAPHAGVVDFGTFTPPTPSLDGIQGEVPQPLIGQENYVLTGNGWSSLGALGALTYQGTWNASTNTPTLVSSVGTQGYYYVVSVAGNTNLNGTTTWDVGDWAIFNGSAWQKIEGGTVGTFTNVITPQVTARTDNLTLSALGTGSVYVNQGTNGATGLVLSNSAFAAASARLFFQNSNGTTSISNIGGNTIEFKTNATVGTTSGIDQFRVSHTTSAVNFVQVTGGATGQGVTIIPQGSDTNVLLALNSKGTSPIQFYTSGLRQFQVANAASAVNFLQVQGASTGNQPFLTSQGNDTNVALGFASKGNGNLNFYTNSGSTLQFQVWDRPSADIYVATRGGVGAVTRASIGAAGTGASGFNIYNSQGQAIRFQTNGEGNSEQFAITHTGTSVNYVQVTGAATGNRPSISAQGSDNPISLDINAKGSAGTVRIGNALSTAFGIFQGVSGQTVVNYPTFIAGQTGFAIQTQATGTDTNVSMAIQPKGTGAIDLAAGSSGVNISNGGTVTAVTIATRGNGYTALPSVAISAPTTAGGVQAVATALLNLNSLTLVSGGTGYTALDVLTVSGVTGGVVTLRVDTVAAGVISTFTVTNFGSGTVSAIPANPVSVTGGTGSGATFNANWNCGNITVGTAGSGYVEQPTVTITGGASNGTAYATIGSDTVVRSLGNNIAFYTPNGRIGFRITDFAGASATGYWNALGGSTAPQLRATGSSSGVILTESAVPIQFQTASVEQFRVAHTAAAVNYIQAQGSATGNATGPIISMQGSDANISTQIQGKGTGSVAVLTPTSLGGTVGNTAELFAARGFNTNQAILRASQFRHTTGTDWTTASIRLGQRIDATDMSYIEFNPSGFAQGLAFQTANSQPINFKTSGGEQLRVANVSSAVNYHGMSGNATGKALQYFAAGSDTNISMAIQPKGTGAIDLAAGSSGLNISNGGTVTAITRTAAGSAYTSFPTMAISAPTTAGGVQATATFTMGLAGVPTITSGGTGYTVGNTLTFVGGAGGTATLTVSTVSGGVITGVTVAGFGLYTALPSNPISVTGGSGSGATFTATWAINSVFTITNAGSGYIEQPTITFSGGGGSGAAAYATVGSGTIVKALGNNINFNTPNSQVLSIVDKNSGGNYPTNTNPSFTMVPSQNAFGASYLGMLTSGYFATNNTSASAYVFATGITPPLNGNGGSAQLQIGHTASAVNYVQVTGAVTTGTPVISAQGSDASIPLQLRSKGNFNISLNNGAGNNGLVVNLTSGTTLANYVEVAPKIAGTSPTISVLGSDTNISLNLVTKGTGTVQQNGNPLAQVNHKYHAFTVGSYYYDTYEQNNYFRLFTQNAAADTIRYGAVNTPEYYDYGTSTWTAWAAGTSGIQNLLDGNPNTGMDVAHANRTFRFVVTNSDGWPTNALVLLQTTWAAITYTTATVTIASGTAVGGPFTSRQVMTFSAANSGNNWGMHAYYTSSLHTGEGFYQITIDITDWVDSGTYVAYPLRNINIFSNYSTVAGRILPFSNSYDRRSTFIGGISTADDVTGSLYVGRYSSADPSTYIDSGSSALRMNLRTQYITQLQVSHTASAVNYVQVTGAATSGQPTISAQGSDTNITLALSPKGTGLINITSAANIARNSFNFIQIAGGAATGNAPSINALGTDTNIDLALTPKGTGNVKYGTHTATADAPITGYIEIKDSGGTIRKLAVIT